jgi:phosphoglucomutase
VTIDPRAGKPLPEDALVDLTRLEQAYYRERPDPARPSERVSFGTSGHRGSALRRTFNEDHIAAIAAAICDWRKAHGVDGPLFMGMDTHALSVPAQTTALEVLAARDVRVLVAPGGGFTPTPAVSRAIIVHNRGGGARADGIVVTPSHNPPEDGGFKYNPPHGGPADSSVTSWIEKRANELLASGGARTIARTPLESALRAGLVTDFDFAARYIGDLEQALDLRRVAEARPKIGVDPMGGASVHYWGRIGEQYGLDLTVVNRAVDKTFRFVPADHDGRIRTDCSSTYAMQNLLRQRGSFDIAVANDADADRHGIVTADAGLLSPNHYLSVAIDYLFRHRPGWPAAASVGKTAVTSQMVNRVAGALGRSIEEVPVGFKWFVPGLQSGTLAFGGEESAGAAFLARDGSTWTTDKDGLLLALLAAEILAVTGKDPGKAYAALEESLGRSHYVRSDAPTTPALRERLRTMTPADWTAPVLAGEAVTAKQVKAAGGGDLGGLKVSTENAWVAVRPSGTEDIYKVYAESFRSVEHLQLVVDEASAFVKRLL